MPPENPMMRKSLVIFCDGTGQDGLISSSGQNPEPKSNAKTYFTNILRLARSVLPHSEFPDTRGMEQIVYYQSGVGSDADFSNNPEKGSQSLQRWGTAVASKIRDVYAFIAANYRPEDEICLFGFSRGAYSVRKVSGLIEKIGLLSPDQMGMFYAYWQYLTDPKTGVKPPTPSFYVPIRVIGCFDTVGSVYPGVFTGKIIDALSIKDNALVPNVGVALHALSFHENRSKFMCTLWDEATKKPGQIVEQVWFGGAHSDVGGGYKDHELADISLFWMVEQLVARKLVSINTKFIAACRSTNSHRVGWGAFNPHNAYYDLSAAQKYIIGCEDRLAGKQITRNSIFHQSLRLSPLKLTYPKDMITLDTLHKKFNSGWEPRFAELGKFEIKMKDEWSESPMFDEPRPTFEDESDITDLLGLDDIDWFENSTSSVFA
ncbi:hypothetical protein SISNIDRAFT_485431 [Sistotremastrum niveocremeum HHB9708]|uniref:T6SS Phospholipase effector Tle1-like catalytic domain-containing protein n=1 Tax=Sistotremastrum niveocremeum HHB9708 TaxID=1314777 RepID=A0A164V581_9AGAM|nr:hypothetical protein SISNIDRAFT_485431 [Sistotremastrum niveocremeum HHB9708]